MDHPTTEKWDQRYRETPDDHQPPPCRVLQENHHLLPATGTALELACGLGANALLLARHGLTTSAWDISAVAIEKLKTQTGQLPLHAQVRDICLEPPPTTSFDVIVVSRFLDRSLAPHIIGALHPGGLLYYQTFICDAVTDEGPTNPIYRLADNELLHLFAPLRLVVYREEGSLGDTKQGFRNEAMLVAQKI